MVGLRTGPEGGAEVTTVTTTTRVFVAVVHEYQTRLEDGTWTPVEIRTNNGREIPMEGMEEALASFYSLFDPRIGKLHESKFDGLFEGGYGYRWKDVGYQIRRVEEQITTQITRGTGA